MDLVINIKLFHFKSFEPNSILNLSWMLHSSSQIYFYIFLLYLIYSIAYLTSSHKLHSGGKIAPHLSTWGSFNFNTIDEETNILVFLSVSSRRRISSHDLQNKLLLCSSEYSLEEFIYNIYKFFSLFFLGQVTTVLDYL